MELKNNLRTWHATFSTTSDMTYINRNTKALGYKKLPRLQGQLMVCNLALTKLDAYLSHPKHPYDHQACKV